MKGEISIDTIQIKNVFKKLMNNFISNLKTQWIKFQKKCEMSKLAQEKIIANLRRLIN